MQDMRLTVAIAAFHDRHTAQRAVADLEKNGFDHKQIGLITPAPDKEGIGKNDDVIGRDHAKGTVAGIGSGAVVGGLVGAAVAILIPGIGTALVAGALAGLATGAVAGGVLGALTGMGVPKRDAEFFSKRFEEGNSLVTVATEDRLVEAREILRRNGGLENAESGQNSELTGTAQPVQASAAQPMVAEPAGGQAMVSEQQMAQQQHPMGNATPPPPPPPPPA